MKISFNIWIRIINLLARTDRSTIRRPSVPFTVRSGFVTPFFDVNEVMDAVEVGWNMVDDVRRV